MWTSVVIGEGDSGNTTCKVFELKGDHNISQNAASYWAANVYLGLGITVMKNTGHGIKIRQMIEQLAACPLEAHGGNSASRVNDYLTDLIIKNIEPVLLQQAVTRALDRAYKDGMNDKATEFRKVLQLAY